MNGINNVNAVQMLKEMQALAGETRGAEPATNSASQPTDFTSALQDAVNHVNGLEQESASLQDAFAAGEDVELTEVMVSMQKSRVAFEATKQVRNHLVEAYQDIFNMPV